MFSLNGHFAMRPIDRKDLEWIRSLRNDQSTWLNLGDLLMVSDTQQEDWFNGLSRDRSRMYFLVYNGALIVCLVRFTQIDWINRSVCVGADIHPQERGQGYGKQVYDLIIAYCFDQLNMNRIWLLVAEYNKIGIKLYERKGFRIEGAMRKAIYRNGRYWDYIIMGLLQKERRCDL